MKYCLIVFLLSAASSAICQRKCDCFDRLYNLANTAKDAQTYINIKKDAISFLEEGQRNEYYWELGEAYNSIQKFDSAALYYKKAIEWGYDIETLKASAYETYRRMDTNKLKAIALSFRKKIDYSVYNKFVQQEFIDQAIRNGTLFPENELFDTTLNPCKKSVIDTEWRKIDKSTYHFLKWVFEKYQFPTFHQLGFYPIGISLFMLHVTAYNNTDADYVFNKLDELNKSGNFPERSMILFMKDRQKAIHGQKTACGLMGTRRFEHIDDITKVDSIRFSYNRIRLKEEAGIAGKDAGELPLNYKPIPYPDNYFCLKKYHFE